MVGVGAAGPATAAAMLSPNKLTVSPSGDVYISDTFNTIRKVVIRLVQSLNGDGILRCVFRYRARVKCLFSRACLVNDVTLVMAVKPPQQFSSLLSWDQFFQQEKFMCWIQQTIVSER